MLPVQSVVFTNDYISPWKVGIVTDLVQAANQFQTELAGTANQSQTDLVVLANQYESNETDMTVTVTVTRSVPDWPSGGR